MTSRELDQSAATVKREVDKAINKAQEGEAVAPKHSVPPHTRKNYGTNVVERKD